MAADEVNAAKEIATGTPFYNGDASQTGQALQSGNLSVKQYYGDTAANLATAGVYGEVKTLNAIYNGEITVNQASQQVGATAVLQLAQAKAIQQAKAGQLKSCFPPGTLVHAVDCLRKIETIRAQRGGMGIRSYRRAVATMPRAANVPPRVSRVVRNHFCRRRANRGDGFPSLLGHKRSIPGGSRPPRTSCAQSQAMRRLPAAGWTPAIWRSAISCSWARADPPKSSPSTDKSSMTSFATSRSRTCTATPLAPTEHWCIITMVRSRRAEQMHRAASSHKDLLARRNPQRSTGNSRQLENRSY